MGGFTGSTFGKEPKARVDIERAFQRLAQATPMLWMEISPKAYAWLCMLDDWGPKLKKL